MIKGILLWMCSKGLHKGGGDFLALYIGPKDEGGFRREELYECKRCGDRWYEDLDTGEERPYCVRN